MMNPQSILDPKLKGLYLKTWRECMTQKNITSSELSPKQTIPITASKPKTESTPKDNTKDIIKTKPITKPKTEDIDSRIKYECKECHAEFKNKTALTTHSYSHNRRYLENTEYFDINSGQNMK